MAIILNHKLLPWQHPTKYWETLLHYLYPQGDQISPASDSAPHAVIGLTDFVFPAPKSRRSVLDLA